MFTSKITKVLVLSSSKMLSMLNQQSFAKVLIHSQHILLNHNLYTEMLVIGTNSFIGIMLTHQN